MLQVLNGYWSKKDPVFVYGEEVLDDIKLLLIQVICIEGHLHYCCRRRMHLQASPRIYQAKNEVSDTAALLKYQRYLH